MERGRQARAHSKRGDAQDWACWMLPQAGQPRPINSLGRSAASERLPEATRLQPQHEFEP